MLVRTRTRTRTRHDNSVQNTVYFMHGRPREFDEQIAVDQAMAAYRLNGPGAMLMNAGTMLNANSPRPSR